MLAQRAAIASQRGPSGPVRDVQVPSELQLEARDD